MLSSCLGCTDFYSGLLFPVLPVGPDDTPVLAFQTGFGISKIRGLGLPKCGDLGQKESGDG